MNTKEAILSQLLENTGKHFLDSGGDNGRMWQQNRKNGIDFNEELRVDEYGVTIPIQVFMETMLDRDQLSEEMEETILSRLKKDGIEYGICYQNSEDISDILKEMFSVDFNSHLCSETWFNTYNYDNDLSQVLQGVIFEVDCDIYCIIETHNGFDVRGGYSSGKVYKIEDVDYFFLGQTVEFSDPSNPDGNPFETFYQMENAGAIFNEKTKCFELDSEECIPYTSALGF
jgi:hypothetical protein